MWDPRCRHPRYSLDQRGNRRLGVLPATSRLCPIPLCPTLTTGDPNPHHFPLIPTPSPVSGRTPQWPGREDPASPRLRPRRGPGFRRTARKPLVRFPAIPARLFHRCRRLLSEERRAGAPAVKCHKLHLLRPALSEPTLPGRRAPASRPRPA